MALRALPRMFSEEQHQFVFRLRRTGAGVVAEGLSPRYTAIALIGLAGESAEARRRALRGQPAAAVYEQLVRAVAGGRSLGDHALCYWAGCALRHPQRHQLLEGIRALRPIETPQPVVELAWTLAALCQERSGSVGDERKLLARRLLGSYSPEARCFPHRLGSPGGLRGHVSCFADLVYPIHALALNHSVTGCDESGEVARRCAALICERQGEVGQWWWHYDRRSGEIIEGYPVYSVHQDSMAPMALFAVAKYCQRDFSRAISLGLDWLAASPELEGRSLIDEAAGLIWRKVARREPRKLVRRLQAGASAVHPRLRFPTETLFPPGAIDYESRPYHMGWVLYAAQLGGAEVS